jgi:hypothetical protein
MLIDYLLEDFGGELLGLASRIELLVHNEELFLVKLASRTIGQESAMPLVYLLARVICIFEQELNFLLKKNQKIHNQITIIE